MKYVALLSGGKDSCFNLLHCAKNGHELVAAASLGPPNGTEEMDSYLYQTVGQDAIEFIARALNVPLFRRVIVGSAVEQGLEYGGRNASESEGTEGDETEDLYELLSYVKSCHPNIQGVSVGAILSNYQRVRVEHACLRLGLIPLCYLWQRNQKELLNEMIQAGMEAILIKVAGVGLTIQHLGKTLAEMQTTLEDLNVMYGSHICGEGGEYETFTLDCSLFQKRIVLTKTEAVIQSGSDFATVAYLRIKEATLVDKPDNDVVNVAVPFVLAEEYKSLLSGSEETAAPLQVETADPQLAELDSTAVIKSSTHCIGPWLAISNIQRDAQSETEMTLEDEVMQCFGNLKEKLMNESLQLSHIITITVLLSSMVDFPRVNSVYKTYFGTSPPARATLAVDLPSSIRIRLDCLVFKAKAPSDRSALHVQGLSYWAPANIGPYSQAVSVDERVFISGQIGMIPQDLSLPSPSSCAVETALSLQHVSRISEALVQNWSGHSNLMAQAFICWLTDSSDLFTIKRICKSVSSLRSVPGLFIGIKSLPKGASVEIQVVSHTCRSGMIDEDGDEVVIREAPVFKKGKATHAGQAASWEISMIPTNGAFYAIVSVTGEMSEDMVHQLRLTPALSPIWEHALSIRIIHKIGRSQEGFTKALFGPSLILAFSHVPVRFIFTPEMEQHDYAMCIFGSRGMPGKRNLLKQ